MQKLKVLVTGSEGFLGKHLGEHLLEQGHRFQGYDIQNGYDILDASELEYAIGQSDVVVHLAAQANVRKSFEEPEETFLINTLGTLQVLKYCKLYSKRLIVASTIAVTDRKSSPYAESKALAEDVLMKFPFVTILRFTNLIGLNMNARSGSMVYAFTQGLKTGKIGIDGDGSVSRDFIHARDIVQIIQAAIEDNAWAGKIVECGSGVSSTVKEIAELFAEFGGVKIEYGPAKPAAAALKADLTVLNELYHNGMTTDVRSDIKEIIEYANYANKNPRS